MESTESTTGSFSYAGSSGFASLGSLGLFEDDSLDGVPSGRANAAGRPPISPRMFANYNQYGLWDSITGDLFSSSSRDSDVHHARQRSAEVLNLDGLHLRDDAGLAGGSSSSQRDKKNQHHGRGQGREPSSSPECSPANVSVRSVPPSPQQANAAGVEGPMDAADKVRRTVYVADVHYLVSEQELAKFFSRCGPLVDFRICGDTNTVLRFAFVEFHSVKSAKAALKLTGSMLGESTIRVSQSKTAIIPVKDQFLPRSERRARFGGQDGVRGEHTPDCGARCAEAIFSDGLWAGVQDSAAGGTRNMIRRLRLSSSRRRIPPPPRFDALVRC